MSTLRAYAPQLPQEEILREERVAEGAAVNTISVTLEIEKHGAEEICRAADSVIRSADVFAVRFTGGGFEESEPRFSRILPAMTAEEALAYMHGRDAARIDPAEKLYEVEIIPAEEKVFLYARFHHVIMDGRGMYLFAQRVLDAIEGKELPFSRYFGAEGQAEADDEAYWKEKFLDFSQETSLFPDGGTGEKLTVPRNFSPSLIGEIAAFAEREGFHLPYAFLAAEALYLARAADADEATVLMSRRNRNAETADTLGCYVLLVPLRIGLEGCESFADLCRRAQEIGREASRHSKIGYSRLAHVAQIKNVSQYGFNYYDFTLSSSVPHKISVSVAGAIGNHLVFNVFAGENMACSLDCRKEVYDEERAGFFFGSMEQILMQGVAGKPLAGIEILGEREKARLNAVRGEEFPIDGSESIPSLLRAVAAEHPNAPAVYAGGKSLTFGELDAQSDAIARALVERGVKQGDKVGFMLKRDIRLLPALFGISKAGAAFIPVDPAYPQDRIDYILQDSAAAFLITSSQTGNGLDIDELLRGGNASLPTVSQTDVAYLIYTSGTTGRPKGVMLTHRGVANIVKPENNPFNRYFTKHCKGLTAIGSICFDISLFEFFVALFNGKFVELADEEGMINPERLSECILAHGADALHCTPTRLASYLRNPRFLAEAEKLKAVLSAGEVLPPSLIASLKELGVHIFNGYGPTEVTIGATITEEGDSRSIGKPIANTGILIADKNGDALPYGVAGEICIYGAGLGLGYLNRPEETAAHFIVRGGRRLYRTGDTGRLLPDGRLLYLGRRDRQVKLRGLRIELPEIESAMLSFAEVTQAACLVKKSRHSEHLVAFYSAARDLGAELKSHISETLTTYMVPDVFVRLPALPQTAGGKTDYKKLETENVDFRGSYRAPASELEKLICGAFEEVLGATDVGADDDFFELGGDSLGAMELMLALERIRKENAPGYSDIYRCPTPAKLAELMDGGSAGEQYPIHDLNYEGIGEYLKAHTPLGGKPLGNVLLTGGTGFLGNHILAELLKSGSAEHIYCLARSKKTMTAAKRIRGALFYYAEDDFTEENRWTAVEGDISSPAIFAEPFEEKIDLIINCAANVAHFAYGDALSRVNEGGVQNLIAYALKTGARLLQISTVSVGGMAKRAALSASLFTEEDLYVGQRIFNEYIYTKFKAEYALLRAAADKGLRVQIMRVGNLQGRLSDGEFQMNLRSNGFTRRLSAYLDIGAVPQSLYDSTVEFSPVDEVAKMVVALAKSGEGGAFHVCPPAETAFSRLFDILKEMGRPVEIVSDEAFAKRIEELKMSGEKSGSVEMLSIERGNADFDYIPFSRADTLKRLAALGCVWREITDDYLKKYLTALGDMDMF